MDRCPTCTRPFKKLTNKQRTRSGAYPGTERQAAEQLGNLSPALKKVYYYMQGKKDIADNLQDPEKAWVSSETLREVLDGGDGPRRVRQLRDEHGIRLDVVTEKRSGKRLMAYYRFLDQIPQAK